jgi:PIN domain nuclease of toxin-antitoxin system
VRLLIDAQALIWYVDQDHLLSPVAHAAMTDPANELLLSVATLWEIGIKVGIGKLPLSLPYCDWMNKAIADLGLIILPIAFADAQANLPKHHGDPFDRMLIAQAQVEGMPVVSADTHFDAYGISRLW